MPTALTLSCLFSTNPESRSARSRSPHDAEAERPRPGVAGGAPGGDQQRVASERQPLRSRQATLEGDPVDTGVPRQRKRGHRDQALACWLVAIAPGLAHAPAPDPAPALGASEGEGEARACDRSNAPSCHPQGREGWGGGGGWGGRPTNPSVVPPPRTGKLGREDRTPQLCDVNRYPAGCA